MPWQPVRFPSKAGRAVLEQQDHQENDGIQQASHGGDSGTAQGVEHPAHQKREAQKGQEKAQGQQPRVTIGTPGQSAPGDSSEGENKTASARQENIQSHLA